MTADFFFFFLNDPAPTEISPLPLPAPLPIGGGDAHEPHDEAGGGADRRDLAGARQIEPRPGDEGGGRGGVGDRKSTRLNSSHSQISYAVFCLKKKKQTIY